MRTQPPKPRVMLQRQIGQGIDDPGVPVVSLEKYLADHEPQCSLPWVL